MLFAGNRVNAESVSAFLQLLIDPRSSCFYLSGIQMLIIIIIIIIIITTILMMMMRMMRRRIFKQ